MIRRKAGARAGAIPAARPGFLRIGALGLALATLVPGAPLDQPPDWARDAIWYQVFVERFRNGDPANDPRPEWMAGAYPGYVPEGWEVTPWGWDWYRPEPWAGADGSGFYRMVQARRYGGDLQGVLDRLDYLEELGVNALYFNPLNDAPSLHKYDARHYRHIDRTFGPDPEGDSALIAAEDPADPSTWAWTAADRLFLHLIGEVHRRGMRLIVDYSWNHTGITFWAWRDLVEKQEGSAYRDWYEVESFDDPATPENEFRYRGWLGVDTLPEWRKFGAGERREGHGFEGDLHPGVKAHIFAVTRRWLDPDGDGDPSDGVDGFRLDVAPHVPFGFWRDYRRFVRGIHPEALLLGECWWTRWPDELMDPRPFLLGGDIFDSVMHYQWYEPARRFLAGADGGLTPTDFAARMTRVYEGYPPSVAQGLMNLAASHDSPRLATSFANRQKYKFRMGARDNPDLDVGPPSAETRRRSRMLLLHQYTMPGAPHIWNGDERGMWGADDPDCRKPVPWEDQPREPESWRPDGSRRGPDEVTVDHDLIDFHRRLIRLRRERPEWRRGAWKMLLADNGTQTLAYRRLLEGGERPGATVVTVNLADEEREIRLPADALPAWTLLCGSSPGVAAGGVVAEGVVRLTLPPLAAAAWGDVAKAR